MRIEKMKTNTVFYFAFLGCVMLGSCKFFSMEPLQITGFTPREEVVAMDSLDRVSITFSANVSRKLVENAFSLEENGIKMQGKFEWAGGKKFFFVPYKSFREASQYLMTVSTSAEDVQGNSLDKDFSWKFSGSPDTQRPDITGITPADKTILDTVRPVLEFAFSEPMNRTSIIEGISFQPSVDGFFIESPDNTSFHFRLEKNLTWQTRYTITIRESVKDLSGNTLGTTKTYTFFTGTDSEKLQLSTIQTSNPPLVLVPDDPDTQEEEITHYVEKDSDIIIAFSKPVEKETANGTIVLAPAHTSSFSWNETGDQLTLSFSKPLVYNTVYTLSVNEGLTDIQGNGLAANAVYKFRANGVSSRPPAIARVYYTNSFHDNYPIEPIIEVETLSFITFPNEVNTSPCYGFFDIHMALADGASVSPFELYSAFAISAQNASITPIAYQTGASITFMVTEIPPEMVPGCEVIRVIVDIDNSMPDYQDTPGKITLSLDTTFHDTLDNHLPETWVMDIYTTN
jgi:hypothetical protein